MGDASAVRLYYAARNHLRFAGREGRGDAGGSLAAMWRGDFDCRAECRPRGSGARRVSAGARGCGRARYRDHFAGRYGRTCTSHLSGDQVTSNLCPATDAINPYRALRITTASVADTDERAGRQACSRRNGDHSGGPSRSATRDRRREDASVARRLRTRRPSIRTSSRSGRQRRRRCRSARRRSSRSSPGRRGAAPPPDNPRRWRRGSVAPIQTESRLAPARASSTATQRVLRVMNALDRVDDDQPVRDHREHDERGCGRADSQPMRALLEPQPDDAGAIPPSAIDVQPDGVVVGREPIAAARASRRSR